MQRPDPRIESGCKLTVDRHSVRFSHAADGLLLVEFLRSQHASICHMPLMVLSGKDDPVIKAEAFALGANDYLVKLPEARELIARIRYHFKLHV